MCVCRGRKGRLQGGEVGRKERVLCVGGWGHTPCGCTQVGRKEALQWQPSRLTCIPQPMVSVFGILCLSTPPRQETRRGARETFVAVGGWWAKREQPCLPESASPPGAAPLSAFLCSVASFGIPGQPDKAPVSVALPAQGPVSSFFWVSIVAGWGALRNIPAG